jgi:hypothetical protein
MFTKILHTMYFSLLQLLSERGDLQACAITIIVEKKRELSTSKNVIARYIDNSDGFLIVGNPPSLFSETTRRSFSVFTSPTWVTS